MRVSSQFSVFWRIPGVAGLITTYVLLNFVFIAFRILLQGKTKELGFFMIYERQTFKVCCNGVKLIHIQIYEDNLFRLYTLSIKSDVVSVYGNFTGTRKIIRIHYGLWVQIVINWFKSHCTISTEWYLCIKVRFTQTFSLKYGNVI